MEEITGSVTVGVQSGMQFFTFAYDILRTNLHPFSFKFGSLDINGKTITFQELPFEQKSGYSSR